MHSSNINEISESTLSAVLCNLFFNMNTEMLIELVRGRPSLYDMSDKKYTDHLRNELM